MKIAWSWQPRRSASNVCWNSDLIMLAVCRDSFLIRFNSSRLYHVLAFSAQLMVRQFSTGRMSSLVQNRTRGEYPTSREDIESLLLATVEWDDKGLIVSFGSFLLLAGRSVVAGDCSVHRADLTRRSLFNTPTGLMVSSIRRKILKRGEDLGVLLVRQNTWWDLWMMKVMCILAWLQRNGRNNLAIVRWSWMFFLPSNNKVMICVKSKPHFFVWQNRNYAFSLSSVSPHDAYVWLNK